jgi:ABC-2 type transport system permease protein
MNIFLWYDNFAGGILDLTAVVFYLSVSAVFLFLTARVLERRRWR